MHKSILTICVGFPLFLILFHTLIRMVRYYYRFPIPDFLTGLIDHPLRRKFVQPPAETALRHGVKPGIHMLEIGPGSGTYTMAAARGVGNKGQMVTVDIEPKIINRLKKRISHKGGPSIKLSVADAQALPFSDHSFDLIYMISVIGEIPEPPQALRECHRVLKPSGTLVFSELLPDPDYPLASHLVRLVESHAFRLKEKKGTFFYYTLIFRKGSFE